MERKKSGRKRKARWETKPGDLPPAWVIEREPRLADIENNAVFRLMRFRRKSGAPGRSIGTTLLLAIICLVLIFTCSVLGIFLAFVAARAIGWTGRRWGKYEVFPDMGAAWMDDLLLSTTGARDAALAVWAEAVGRRRLLLRRILLWCVLALLWATLGFLIYTFMRSPADDVAFGLVAGVAALFIGMAGFGLGALNSAPYPDLANLRQRLLRDRVRMESPSFVNRVAGELALGFTQVLIVLAAALSIGGAVIGGHLLLAAWLEPPPWLLGPIAGAAGSLGGIWAGRLWGSFQRRRAERNLEQMTADARAILDAMLRRNETAGKD